MKIQITPELIQKINSLLDKGLIKGIGEPLPGQMCVEALICYALNLPHNDNPPCVAPIVRDLKIKLNDSKYWPSNTDRANGLRRLSIAQLNSLGIDNIKFKEQVFYHNQKDIIPLTFDWIPIKDRISEHQELKEFCEKETDRKKLIHKFKGIGEPTKHYTRTKLYYNYYFNYYYFNYFNYYFNYYYYYNYFNYNYTPEQNYTLLKLSAECAVKALQDLNVEGCQYL